MSAVDLVVLDQAWRLLKKERMTWVLASLLTAVVFGLVSFLLSRITIGVSSSASLFVMLTLPFLTSAFLAVVAYALSAGLIHMALKQLKGESIRVMDVFSYGAKSEILLTAAMVGTATGVGTVLFFLPGMFVGGLFMFAIPMVLDKNLKALDAVKFSYQTLAPQMWMAMVVYLVLSLVAGLGVMLCFVGGLITVPLMALSVAGLYAEFFWPHLIKRA